MHRQGERHQRLVAIFALGLMLFLPPVLLVFNRPVLAAGVPILYLFLFLAWGVIIALGALATRRLDWHGEPAPPARGATGEGLPATPDRSELGDA